MRTPRRQLPFIAGCVISLLTSIAWSHHSFAMFDQSKSVPLQGVVKDFRWTNPHVFIQLLAQGANGADEEWSIEMTSPEHLARAGWRPGTLKAGDKVSVVIHPMRDTTRGGQYVRGTGPAGPLGQAPRQPRESSHAGG